MRILLISPVFFIPWVDYTASALRQLGHSVETFPCTDLLVDRLTLRRGPALASGIPGLTGWLERRRRQWHRRRDERLLSRARRFKPELLLLLNGESFSKDFLQRLKREAGCPLAAWWVDNPFKHPIRELFPLYDRLFIFDRSYIAPLKEAGAPDIRFLPCAVDETVYRPQTLTPAERRRYASDIAMVAWCYDRRLEMAHALAGMDLKIWGKGWRSPQARAILNGSAPRIEERFVPDREAARIYSAAKIGLNVHAGQTRQAGLNTRSFELLASGCFQLTDAVEGMEELLEPGREVAVYRSAGEARDLARHYLDHPEERSAMAQRGRARVLAQHTYLHRMRSLLGSL